MTQSNIDTKKLGIDVDSYSIEEGSNFEQPKKIRDEIPTLNKMGYMKTDLDDYSSAFIEHATSIDYPVLELGCAYGFVVKQVLEKGGNIVASDLSQDHLSCLKSSVPVEHLERLIIYPGAFPDEINFSLESLGAVYSSRMFHFLTGAEIKRGLDKIHDWLIKGGKFYFVSCTPHHDAFREKFLHIYQERVKNKEEWPGVIENHHEINPDHKDFVGNYLNIFDIPLMEELLPKHGFEIEKISLFSYPEDTTGGDKGHIGFIARKV